MAAADLTAARLRELLNYDPETGGFTRRIDSGCGGRIKAGTKAGTPDAHGYISIPIGSSMFKAHRLAWLYVYGAWPEQSIDHINGIRNDNRISNLRDVSQSMNCQNRRSPIERNKSGFLGVSWHKGAGRWAASIMVEGKRTHIGLFDSPADASSAYLERKRLSHPGSTL